MEKTRALENLPCPGFEALCDTCLLQAVCDSGCKPHGAVFTVNRSKNKFECTWFAPTAYYAPTND